jgi:NAD(P)H-hydrate repair Nnr-like enzyme with NAD(P)H-hydrate dehydratase domain
VAGGIGAAGSAAATAGAGVAVGGAISAAGALVKPGAKLVRYLKQKGRDKAEKETDPNSRWKKVFDEKKSTQKKDQEYQGRAAEIFAGRADPDMQDIFKNLPKVTSKEIELYQAGKLDAAAIEKILRRRD